MLGNSFLTLGRYWGRDEHMTNRSYTSNKHTTYNASTYHVKRKKYVGSSHSLWLFYRTVIILAK